MTTGKLIFIEGVNGSGKTTQVKLLQQVYTNIIFTKQPFSINANRDVSENPLEQALLYAADRTRHMANLKPDLEFFNIICDRGPLSTMAYQGTALRDMYNWDKRAVPAWSFLWTANEWAMQDVPVAATIILTVPPDVAVKRVKLRAKGEGRSYGPKYLADLKRAADWYLNITLNASSEERLACAGTVHHVDANRPADIVHEDMVQLINNILKD